LTVGTHYYVCTPHAAFGMKGRIVVQAATGNQIVLAETDLVVYPNPIGQAFSIQLMATEPEYLELSVYSLQGNLLQVLLPKAQVSGAVQLEFQRPSSLASGIYLIKETFGKRTRFNKVILL
jgi:hypothetical protein